MIDPRMFAATASFAVLTLAFPAGDAVAQTTRSVAGTYALVANATLGDKPRGLMILDLDGNYVNVVRRATLPKIASGSRLGGTPDENKELVGGAIAHYGRYSIDDDGKTLTLRIEMSTYPNWDGTIQKRPLTISGDQLSYTVPASSASGTPVEVIWKRVK